MLSSGQSLAYSSTAAIQDQPGNGLLRSLPAGEYQRLLPNLLAINLRNRQVLYEPGQRIRFAYFPLDAVVSLLLPMEDGSSVEVGMVGRQGLAGIRIPLGTQVAPHRAVVEIAGRALRIRAEELSRASAGYPALHSLMLAYAECCLTGTAQRVACSRLHPLEKRLCRWLLELQDLTSVEEFSVTQEMISRRLGVRREAVTVAARALQAAELISHGRARIRITNRLALERASCECYRVIAGETSRLLDRFSAQPGATT